MSEKVIANSPLVDRFSRTISYLRLSLTDRCNLRCMYCMPEGEGEPLPFIPHRDLLTYEELLRVVELAVGMGMSKLRLTGGEPLLRKGVMGFIHSLSQIEGLEQIRLTTNGVLLGRCAEELLEAGVTRINVSLDTLQRQKFVDITGRDHFDEVWHSLTKAAELGFKIKLNAVAMRGVNDDEFEDFARLALEWPFQVRFIEFMPTGSAGSWSRGRFIAADEIMERLRPLGTFSAVEGRRAEGPARIYQLESGDRRGMVGFISPISHHFCDRCNRLRLTSEGRLRPCLLRSLETDLRALLRGGADDEAVRRAIRETILNKPGGHELTNVAEVEEKSRHSGGMSKIGG